MITIFGILKFWKWRIFHRQKKPNQVTRTEIEKETHEKKISSVYPSRDMILLTSESDMRLRPCTVNDDHTINFRKKKITIKPDRPAHIFDLNIRDLLPTKRQRIFARFFDVPFFQTFRVYTCQEEGELTHDPNLDHLDEEMKMKFEKLLHLMGKFAEADAGAVIYEGIKGPKKWWDYIPYLVILGIVIIFLFAFQIQPNM